MSIGTMATWQVISFQLIPLKTPVSFRWTVPLKALGYDIPQYVYFTHFFRVNVPLSIRGRVHDSKTSTKNHWRFKKI
jgi:hypothetical protein